jgi:alkylation response protein AidB-like acyl-CoA dehydrogenase
MAHSSAHTGGSFLIEETTAKQIFSPEDFSEEQLMIRDMTRQFVELEVQPQMEKIEQKQWDVTVGLLKRCAELGLLGIEVPEKYGGENLDKVSAMIVAEQLGGVASFSVSYGGQGGIGTLPIVYFGTEDQKRYYLPQLCKAEKISAYALSESGSGSDALAAKASAVRSPDGKHWIMNGEKMWITNAAFADMFITFAQAEGDQFTCFIVEKEYPGVSTGAEEHKMGLRGSSTRPLILNNAQIPIANVIGEIGKGHRVAFNILNIGRAKLAAGAVGGAKAALNEAVPYAKQRTAFGRSIASFGAIKHKLAEMATRIWVAEGMVYRTAGLMDQSLQSADPENTSQVLKAIEEYAIECSILKVFCSEVLDFAVDEAVQVYGGYGYSAEYPVERYYRDSRVYRIFEGTNEINRLLISSMLLKRSAAGRLDLLEAAHSAFAEGMSLKVPDSSSEKLAVERSALAQAKKALLFIVGSAVQKLGDSIREEQEVLMHLSNIVMEVYAMDTAIHRLMKRESFASGPHMDMTRTFINDGMSRVESSARQVLAATAEGDDLRARLAALGTLLQWLPVNTVRARQRIADFLIEHGRYAF